MSTPSRNDTRSSRFPVDTGARTPGYQENVPKKACGGGLLCFHLLATLSFVFHFTSGPLEATDAVVRELCVAPSLSRLTGLEMRHPGAVNVRCNADVTFESDVNI